jgi:hypothetical protein
MGAVCCRSNSSLADYLLVKRVSTGPADRGTQPAGPQVKPAPLARAIWSVALTGK